MTAKKIKFLRRNTGEYLRLGRKRRKLQKWRRPKGRDNKMRLKEKGRPRTVEIGYRKSKKIRGKIGGKNIVIIRNLRELENADRNQIIMLAKIGNKKKLEIAKKAKEKKLEIINLDESKLKIKTKKVEEKKIDDKSKEKIEETKKFGEKENE